MQAIVMIGVAFVSEVVLSGVTLPPRTPLGAIEPGRATAVLLPIQPAIATARADPCEELHHAVDLVVVTAVGEGEELVFELGQPIRLLRNHHHPFLEPCRLRREPSLFVQGRLESDDRRGSVLVRSITA